MFDGKMVLESVAISVPCLVLLTEAQEGIRDGLSVLLAEGTKLEGLGESLGK